MSTVSERSAEAEALHRQGLEALRRHDPVAAEEALLRALEKSPSDPALHVNLGLARQRRRNLDGAEHAYRRALQIDPDRIGALQGLAAVLGERARWSEAETHLRRALELEPHRVDLLCNLAGTLGSADRFDEAVKLYRQALELDPTSHRAFEGLAWALPMAGADHEMLPLVRRWVSHHPQNPVARHLAASLGQRPMPPRCEAAYIESFFDGFAPTYDKTLSDLEYRVPNLVQDRMSMWLGCPTSALTVLDAGCGTGLCGPVLRPWARQLHGVDLSAGMLSQARKREVYDALHEAELITWLNEAPAAFDVIVAADVLVYFGDLAPVFAAARRVLSPKGVLMFTVEQSEGQSDAPFFLAPKGRFVHRDTDLRRWAQEARFEVIELTEVALRMDRGELEPGWLMVARPQE